MPFTRAFNAYDKRQSVNPNQIIVLFRYNERPNAWPNRSLYLDLITPLRSLFKICVINSAPSDKK